MPSRTSTWPLWALTFLFSLRVSGQALQLAWPQPWLPPAAAFQGSGLPYPVLLGAQLLILTLMLRVAWRAQAGGLQPDPRRGRALAWFGGTYLVLACVRLGIGLAWAGAPRWFHAWIPAMFHPVLAVFVLMWAAQHRGGARP